MYAESRTHTPSRGIVSVVQDPWPVTGENAASSMLPAYRKVSDGLLFEYYLSHVSGTFASVHRDPALVKIWKSGVPAVAFSSPGTSHAIRAISAVCMNKTQGGTQTSPLDYQATAKLHYGRAMQLMRMSIDQSTSVSLDEVMSCCMALAACGVALAVAPSAYEEMYGDWIVHLRACQTLGDILSGAGKLQERQHELIGFPQPSNPGLDRPASDDSMDFIEPLINSSHMLRGIRGAKREVIEKLRLAVAVVDSQLHSSDNQDLVVAINRLEYLYHYITECRVHSYYRAVLHWIVQVPTRYVQLLVAGDEIANVIFAGWLVATLAVDDLWWFRGFGSCRLRLIAEKFKQTNSPYRSLLVWPTEMARQRELAWRVSGVS